MSRLILWCYWYGRRIDDLYHGAVKHPVLMVSSFIGVSHHQRHPSASSVVVVRLDWRCPSYLLIVVFTILRASLCFLSCSILQCVSIRMFALMVLSVVADGRDQQLTMLRQCRGCSECTLAAVRLSLVGHNSWSLLVAVDRHGHPSLLIIVVHRILRSCPPIVVAQDRDHPLPRTTTIVSSSRRLESRRRSLPSSRTPAYPLPPAPIPSLSLYRQTVVAQL